MTLSSITAPFPRIAQMLRFSLASFQKPFHQVGQPFLRAVLIASQLLSLCALSATSSRTQLALAGAPSTQAQASPDQTVLPAGDITGTIFDDYNTDGYRNISSTLALPAVDVGVAGVMVSAYNDTNALVATSNTDATGQYTLTTNLPAGTPLRVEFTGYKALGYESGSHGTDSDSSVRFISTTTSTISGLNFGVYKPKDYCQNVPNLFVTKFVFSDNLTGPFNDKPTCYTLPYNAESSKAELNANLKTSRALANQTGAVYGVAYHKPSKKVFVSAFLKRGTSFGVGFDGAGSDGSGTIYIVDPSSVLGASAFIDLDVVMGSDVTGPNPHPLSDYEPRDQNQSFDKFAYPLVGKMSLGDIDVDENFKNLWVVNMYDRALYKLPIGDGATPTAPTAAQIVTYTIPSPNCLNGTGRPMAIKPINGKVYVGGVCTGESITSTKGITYMAGVTQVNGLAVDLRAYVYLFDVASGTFSPAPVLEFPLNYANGCADISVDYNTVCGKSSKKGAVGDWRPWLDSFQQLVNDNFPAGFAIDTIIGDVFTSYPQALLADIEILDNGDMVIGLRDRFSDQIGYLDPGPEEQKPYGVDVIAVAAGDILRASPKGDGTFVLENNAQSVPAGRFGPSAGKDVLQGPGGGEFYWGDSNAPQTHDEGNYGSFAQIPGVPEIAEGFADPINPFSAGVVWFNHNTGSQNRAYQVYDNNELGNFAKANGQGDLEVLCEFAPIEIGNRIWLDANNNGIQDANEPPIPNILVTLTDENGNTRQTTSNASGHYYFSSTNNPTITQPTQANIRSALSPNAAAVLLPLKPYTVSIDVTQPALFPYLLTAPNRADGSPNGDIRDSDSFLAGNLAVITLTTGITGANNHTYDFGFNKAPEPRVGIGNYVWYDVNNNGMADAGEVGVDGVTVQLGIDTNGNASFDASDTLISTTTTMSGGLYLFDGLTATVSATSTYLVVLPATNFCAGGVLQNYQNSTGNAGGNSDVNNKDHGVDPASKLTCGGVIASTAVSLTVGGEPTNDGDLNSSSNLTLDFGFYKLDLGNYVWYDRNHDGKLSVGEEGLPSIPVRLLDSSNAVLSQTTTNASGFYTFTNLAPGNYCAEIDVPPGYLRSVGPGSSPTPNDDMDSDNNGVTSIGDIARSNCMLLSPGSEPIVITATGTSQNPTLDFGIWRPAGLGNYVWLDANRDGLQTIGELPKQDVQVTLFNSSSVQISNTKTDLNGFYIFTGLIPSSYYVCFTAPNGFTFTQWMSGTDMTSDTDSNADKNKGGCVLPVTLQPGEFNPTLDAGLVTPLSGLGDYVWFDVNNDGRQSAGELPKQDVQVTLFNSSSVQISSTKTDLNGFYIFTGLIPSSYYVCFTAPNGFTFTQWMSGTDMTNDTDSNADKNKGGCVLPVTLQPGEFNPTLDAGLVVLTETRSVHLLGFSASANGNAVRLRWNTGSELNTFGFVLYRSETNNRESAVLVTQQLIPAQGGNSSYSTNDTTADLNKHYTYWLVEVETDGSMNEYAPTQFVPSLITAVVGGGVPAPSVFVDGVATGVETGAGVLPAAQTQPQAQTQVAVNVATSQIATQAEAALYKAQASVPPETNATQAQLVAPTTARNSAPNTQQPLVNQPNTAPAEVVKTTATENSVAVSASAKPQAQSTKQKAVVATPIPSITPRMAISALGMMLLVLLIGGGIAGLAFVLGRKEQS